MFSSYSIHFTFRGTQHKALVHDYGNSYWVVYFNHESPDIIQSFGYKVELFAHEMKGREGKEAKDLERSIRGQLK